MQGQELIAFLEEPACHWVIRNGTAAPMVFAMASVAYVTLLLSRCASIRVFRKLRSAVPKTRIVKAGAFARRWELLVKLKFAWIVQVVASVARHVVDVMVVRGQQRQYAKRRYLSVV
jgi:hypothetical protein